MRARLTCCAETLRAVAIVCWLPLGLSAAEAEVVFDFEQPGLGDSFSAAGKLSASRVALPKAELPDGGGPAGFGVELKSEGGGGLFSKPGKLPADLLKTAEVELWVFRSADEAKAHPTGVIEVQFLEAGRTARFFRKVELTHTGWKKFELPLRWFRWSGGVPRWDRVDRLGLYFREPAAVRIDGIALDRSADPRGALLSPADLLPLAFAGAKAGSVQQQVSEQRAILTNCPQFDVAAFDKHLAAVDAAVLADLPFLAAPSNRPTLLVFATEAEYRQFTPRLAERLNSRAESPRSGGYTLHGLATSYWLPDADRPRPVFTHEYVHSLLSLRAGLDNSGEWLQEGLANYYQLRFHPQDLRAIVAAGLADANQRLPLEELASGKPVPSNRYWQAVTLIELLYTDKYRGKLPKLFAALAAAGSTDLGPHLTPILGTDWAGLTADWRKHCESRK